MEKINKIKKGCVCAMGMKRNWMKQLIENKLLNQ